MTKEFNRYESKIDNVAGVVSVIAFASFIMMVATDLYRYSESKKNQVITHQNVTQVNTTNLDEK